MSPSLEQLREMLRGDLCGCCRKAMEPAECPGCGDPVCSTCIQTERHICAKDYVARLDNSLLLYAQQEKRPRLERHGMGDNMMCSWCLDNEQEPFDTPYPRHYTDGGRVAHLVAGCKFHEKYGPEWGFCLTPGVKCLECFRTDTHSCPICHQELCPEHHEVHATECDGKLGIECSDCRVRYTAKLVTCGNCGKTTCEGCLIPIHGPGKCSKKRKPLPRPMTWRKSERDEHPRSNCHGCDCPIIEASGECLSCGENYCDDCYAEHYDWHPDCRDPDEHDE